jgi:carboxypeptidase C (cathepsin A)
MHRADIIASLCGALRLGLIGVAAAPLMALAAPSPGAAISKAATIWIDGHSLPYVTTAGTIAIRGSDGAISAEMFYVAYTVARQPGSPARPVTFAFNGGPGSSSSPLLLAALGPVRVNLELPVTAATGAVTLGPNDATLLDRSDLVVLDAVGTGFSHAVGPAADRDFWGVDEDIDSFAKAITGWLGANGRWTSPVALVGESYAGTRAAGLAPLLSAPSLDLYSDTFFATLLPSYAAAAWYHDRLGTRPATLQPFLAEVSRYALGPYLAALAQGSALDPPTRLAVATQLHRFTGLDVDYILRSNLRINLFQFKKRLLSDRQLTIGELDDRQTGVDVDPTTVEPETDPASVAIKATLTTAINAYLGDLGYVADRPYRYNYPAAQDVWDWMRRARDYYPWVARPAYVDLATAVTRYPAVHVITLMGYYDLASPFLQTEYDLAHMPLDPRLAGNFTARHYASGHMMYVDSDSRHQMKRDLDRFFDDHVIDRPARAP